MLTHFSTVGIEAHVLKKMTIAVNPFDSELIFDLPNMRVAHLARSAADIVDIVRNKNPLPSADTMLTDGQSIKRLKWMVDKMLATPKAVVADSAEDLALNSKNTVPRQNAKAVAKPRGVPEHVWHALPGWARTQLMPFARRIRDARHGPSKKV